MNISDIEHIIRILKSNDVTEFELEQEGTRIRLSRTPHGGFNVQHASAFEVKPAVHVEMRSGSDGSIPAENADHGRLVKVESPIVGTFYRRPSPESELFAKEGDTVRKGQTLCIIEAMKLMNEIESPTSGKLVKILGTDGHVVEFGEILFMIDPSA